MSCESMMLPWPAPASAPELPTTAHLPHVNFASTACPETGRRCGGKAAICDSGGARARVCWLRKRSSGGRSSGRDSGKSSKVALSTPALRVHSRTRFPNAAMCACLPGLPTGAPGECVIRAPFPTSRAPSPVPASSPSSSSASGSTSTDPYACSSSSSDTSSFSSSSACIFFLRTRSISILRWSISLARRWRWASDTLTPCAFADSISLMRRAFMALASSYFGLFFPRGASSPSLLLLL
mmetsp:Transcript_35111/g.48705  ORF Transcript_35111/g.48705 Transcript_35111/m.48705 type:complete len:239 (-) Transcript_35111:816-1532(-)